MFSRIYHFLKGPNPLNPQVWANHLAPLTFRRFAIEDLPKCLELYSLNEAGRFPQGVIEQYEQSLRDGTSYYLVAESEGQIIASGGVSYWSREDAAVMCFGLVRPSHQGQGVGTALLLARLSLLSPKLPEYHVVIFAVEKSFGFYRRFGFQNPVAWQDSQGGQHPTGHLVFTSAEIHRCRALLKSRGVEVPQDEDKVPFRPKKA